MLDHPTQSTADAFDENAHLKAHIAATQRTEPIGALRSPEELAEIARRRLSRAVRSGRPDHIEAALRANGEHLSDDELAAVHEKLEAARHAAMSRDDARALRRRIVFEREKIIGEWQQAMVTHAEREARIRLGLEAPEDHDVPGNADPASPAPSPSTKRKGKTS